MLNYKSLGNELRVDLLFELKLKSLEKRQSFQYTRYNKEYDDANVNQQNCQVAQNNLEAQNNRDKVRLKNGVEKNTQPRDNLNRSPTMKKRVGFKSRPRPNPGLSVLSQNTIFDLEKWQQKTQSKDSLNRSQYKKTALLNTTP